MSVTYQAMINQVEDRLERIRWMLDVEWVRLTFAGKGDAVPIGLWQVSVPADDDLADVVTLGERFGLPDAIEEAESTAERILDSEGPQ